MASIGIVGAGTAGLHLGLKLLSHGVPVTLYAEQDPERVRATGQLSCTVAHHAATRARERALKVEHWGGPDDSGLHHVRVNVVAGPQSFGFHGRLGSPSLFVDYRLYHPALTEDFVARGGVLKVSAVAPADLERLSTEHELVVVATGRGGLASLFPRIPELSPHTKPPRLLFAALVKGLRFSEPHANGVNLIPGQGEIFESVLVGRDGPVSSLLVEAQPGSELAALGTQRYDADPRAFDALLLDRLRRFAPSTYERVDPAHFGVLGPRDWLQGAFTPVVREGWKRLGNGRCVMALGDAHVSNDPIAGQGANAASASAFALALKVVITLREGRPFDEDFCRDAEKRTWAAAAPATLWSNAMLQPPPPHLVDLLVASARDVRVADAFVTTLMSAEAALTHFATPESVAAFIAHVTGRRPSHTGIKRVA
jgi:2-polyprenyl-6-methoxyphenol hydroxylase-like FAD-dependent oxidoreductase